jgi:crotonobetainyl-CoA:carnitine CoA-transferase CaiB-like acyl-CoA transferase
MAHHDALDAALSAWTRGFEPYELMLKLQAPGIPAGVCQTAGDRCDNDPQLRHLGWLTELTGTRTGRWPLAEVPVRMSRTPRTWAADPTARPRCTARTTKRSSPACSACRPTR